jgi:hypothetical protein
MQAQAYPPTEYELMDNYGLTLGDLADGFCWSDNDGDWQYHKEYKQWIGIDNTEGVIHAEALILDEVDIIETGGKAYGFGVNGALGGGIGFEIGLVTDANDDWGLYFSFKVNAGLGADVGLNVTDIQPTHDGKFELQDFEGTSLEVSASINTPLGGGGVSVGGTSPDVGESFQDRVSNVGKDKRGYQTGTVSPELNGPSPKVSGGAMITKSKTWVWKF